MSPKHTVCGDSPAQKIQYTGIGNSAPSTKTMISPKHRRILSKKNYNKRREIGVFGLPCLFLSLLIGVMSSCGPLVRTAQEEVSYTSKESSLITDRIWEYSLTHPEGFTLDIRGMEEPKEGICVAYAATQDMHSKDNLGYVVSHSLEHDGFVGGWWDSTDSLYYFDSVRIIPESQAEEAVSFALDNGQLAVYVLSTGEEIRIDNVIHPHEIEPSETGGYTTIFLAGTIDNGNSEDWQQSVAGKFAAKEGRYLFYNPRQEEWHPEREGEMDYQVNWELEHMEKADHILMVFLPGSSSPITLLELGLHAKSGKLTVVCTPEFYRYDNVRITCERYGIPLFGSLDEAIDSLP